MSIIVTSRPWTLIIPSFLSSVSSLTVFSSEIADNSHFTQCHSGDNVTAFFIAFTAFVIKPGKHRRGKMCTCDCVSLLVGNPPLHNAAEAERYVAKISDLTFDSIDLDGHNAVFVSYQILEFGVFFANCQIALSNGLVATITLSTTIEYSEVIANEFIDMLESIDIK